MIRKIGRRTFDFSRSVAVMAVVNRTPDSFHDRGATFELDAALRAVDRALDEGADWIDVGGVRAGPGPEVSEQEELERVLPVVYGIRMRSDDVVISVETWRPEVARQAAEAGANVVNDVFGLYDPTLAEVVAETGSCLVLTHYGRPPRTPRTRPRYGDVVMEVAAFLRHRAAMAQQRGVPPDRLIIDPGFDMQKTAFHSLELLRRLERFAALGYPLLVSVSNKDFIGETLDLPVDNRLEGTLAALTVCIVKGANIVRMHNVRAAVRVVRMTEAILGWRAPARPVHGL
jgi:dihydropteroate synthase